MTFTETILKGAFIIELQRNEDERGFFARTFCQNEFKAQGLNPCVAQCNISYNKRKGTFRGMHYQIPPYEEDKLVSCIQGAMLDYIVDLRKDSCTFKQWIAVELTPENGRALYVPRSFAHGFITLRDDTTVHYQMSEFYQPDYGRGFRFDDPAINMELPMPVTTLAEKDTRMSELFV